MRFKHGCARSSERAAKLTGGLATMLAVLVLVPAMPASAASGGAGATAALRAGAAALSPHGASLSVASTPSDVAPHWACPSGACEAIVEPRPQRVASRSFALPSSARLLEGSGELGGYDPQDLQAAYRIPAGGGSGQTIALVDAYGYAAAEADLAKYRERYGLPPCTTASGCFRKVNQRGEEASYPPEERESGWQAETALDLDMASAACPDCHILLVQASSELEPSTGEAVNEAATLGATEISNSYGYPEEFKPWCATTGCAPYATYYKHPGIAVLASSGDSGYDNMDFPAASPDFPASSPDVIAVGGTALKHAPNARGWSEGVWSASGGGCSRFEPKPPWQADPSCAGRMDNDVAAVGACETPVSVYSSYLGGWEDLCGTSVSSPLLAGIVAHASESIRSLGAAAYYANPRSLFDITRGANGTCTPPAEDAYLCRAQAGYDGPSGNGTPDEVPGAARPSVASVEPAEGAAAGATSVTITGANLAGASAVEFGGAPAAAFTVEGPSRISALSPPGAGTVDVTVATSEGTSSSSAADVFGYAHTPPEFGRCVKVAKGSGRYSSGTCTLTSTGGAYEWEPGAVKSAFTTSGKVSTLETVTKLVVKCTAESSSGSYRGPRGLANVLVTFAGCKRVTTACSSPGSAPGEIVSEQLDGALEWESRSAKKVVLDLYSSQQEGLVARFACGAGSYEVQGSLLVPEKVGRMSLSSTLKVAQSKGKQIPSFYENGAGAPVGDALETSLAGESFAQTGLAISTDVQTNEEPIEVSAVA